MFENLLESVSRDRLLVARKRLIERIGDGAIACSLGTLRESIGSDFFTKITSDVAHKRAMIGFDNVPNADVWRKIATVTAANDFKLQRAQRSGSYASLDLVPEDAPYTVKKFKEAEENWRVQKYGNIEAWSLEAMANDELGRLGRTMERFGAAAARTVLNFVFNTLIDANPTLGNDSTTLFHANHNNLVSGALSLATLESAWNKLRTQTGDDGEKLDLVPRFLIVNPDAEVIAHRLVGSAMLITGNTTTEAAGNFFNGRLEVIATNYVTSGNSYLAADPSQIDTVEVGFFRGQQKPTTSVEVKGSGHEFEFDSMRTKTRYIFGGAPLDYRWIVKMA